MRNLQYEMRICQKIHNKVAKTVYVWLESLRIRRQQLICVPFLTFESIRRIKSPLEIPLYQKYAYFVTFQDKKRRRGKFKDSRFYECSLMYSRLANTMQNRNNLRYEFQVEHSNQIADLTINLNLFFFFTMKMKSIIHPFFIPKLNRTIYSKTKLILIHICQTALIYLNHVNFSTYVSI